MTAPLATDRLTLRQPRGEDWPAFHAFYNTPRCEFVGGVRSPHDTWRAFAAELGHWTIRGYGMWIVTETGADDTAIGMVGPWNPVGWPEPELGWMMWDPGVEGRGYAHEAARAARAHVYDALGWPTAVSYIAPDNHRSRALAERLGCTLDPCAATPGTAPMLVYRHPAPEMSS